MSILQKGAPRPQHPSPGTDAVLPLPRSAQARPSSRPRSRPRASTSLFPFCRERSGPCAGGPRRSPRAARLVLGRCMRGGRPAVRAWATCRPERVLCAGPWAGVRTASTHASSCGGSCDDKEKSKTVLALRLPLGTAGGQQSRLPVTPQASSRLGRWAHVGTRPPWRQT